MEVFFQPTYYQQSSALFISCNKLHATIYDFLRSVHLDARQNQSRNELKCGDFWRYFFNQHIINRQARYSFRATSCTLRFYKKMTALYFSSRMSRNGALTIFAKSCGTSSTLNPRLPPETKIVSKLRADCSITVATRFFCPNGLMPPTK